MTGSFSALLQAQAQYAAAVKKFELEQKEVEGLLQQRDNAYLDMLAISEDNSSMTAGSAQGDFSLKGAENACKIRLVYHCCLCTDAIFPR